MALYGLIGEKLGHSYSGIIHESFFKYQNCNDSYNLLEIPRDSLREEFEAISRKYSGVNVTIPYKIEVMKYLDSISSEAEKIGAVNTVRFTSQGAEGYNTDYFGLMCTFRVNDIDIKDKKIVILGTGGVSKAALSVCRDMDAGEITFVSTSNPHIEGYRVITYDDTIEGDVLINCTPVGMYPNVGVSPLKDVSNSFSAVVDTIYNPSVTKLMESARLKGIKAVSGLYMLVAQAMYSRAIWRDEQIDEKIIDTVYRELKSK